MLVRSLQTRLAGVVMLLALVTLMVLSLSPAPLSLKVQFLASMTLVGCVYVGFHLVVDIAQEKLLGLTARR